MASLSLLRIFFEVSRLIGLSNLHYDHRKQFFRHDHVPTIAYCLLLDVAYVLVLPIATVVLTGNLYTCPDMGMFAAVYNVVGLVKLVTVVLLMGSVWFQRRRLQNLGNEFLAMLRRFRFAMGNDCRRRCLWKLLLTTSRFVLMVQQLLVRDSLIKCKMSSKFERSLAPIFSAAMVFSLLMLLLVSYVDLTVYMIQVNGNWLLENMSQNAREMVQDLKTLPKRNGNIRNMGLRQVLRAWQRVWERCMRLDRVLQQLLEIFQWQLLFNLLTTYIFNIATLFRMWIYIEYDQNFHLWKGILSAIIFLVHHVEIMMQFSVFEINRKKWQELFDSMEGLWFMTCFGNRCESRHELVLSRKLEFFLLYLSRKLQREPQRVRRLHIAGLFDLSLHSVHRMTRSVVSNVLVLCQIAYKIYG
ncbi:uncharacterized protein Dana_GF13280 [Drosophila ananassae]|uniref:Gustatory receptor n=1 Tax=Drosophila ananassae TaxID=7217 RepID=B3MJ27_DROAN|nr:putative gustatory receptor 58c [Drosophila ananassae]EDV37093.1 uncharacterized protein Dana_GF13280 [Drosophila ananassae]